MWKHITRYNTHGVNSSVLTVISLLIFTVGVIHDFQERVFQKLSTGENETLWYTMHSYSSLKKET